jgi:hypothetical protein
MFKPETLEEVVKFDVDAEVVGVEFEFIAGAEAAILVDVHGQSSDAAVDGEFPVARTGSRRVEEDLVLGFDFLGHGILWGGKEALTLKYRPGTERRCAV